MCKHVHCFNFLQYYYKRLDYWVLEKDLKVKIGDLVLIRLMDEAYSPRVKFEIYKYLHQLGEMICPITGQGVRGLEYVDPARTDHIGNFPEKWQDNVMNNTMVQRMRLLELGKELETKEQELNNDDEDDDEDDDGETFV